MPTRNATARWNGSLREGNGTFESATGTISGSYNFSSRFEDGSGTNPEELIASAHAACYSMALASELGKAGHVPETVETTAKVHLEMGEGGPSIAKIQLVTSVTAPGIEDAQFQEIATATKAACPVSKALAAVEITLEASLA